MDRGIKVLIVEDEPAIARGLAAAIERLDGDFTIAGICRNGEDGLKQILSRDIHLVFADIRMPVMDGLTMIKKAREQNCSAAFVILSGYEQFEYAHSAFSLDVMRYLLKPVNTHELYTLLVHYKETIFKKIFEERRYLQSPHITVLWDSLPSTPDIESLSALCDATLRFWHDQRIGREQMKTDIGYILNLCLQKGVHKPASFPGMETILEAADDSAKLRLLLLDMLEDIFFRKKDGGKKQSLPVVQDLKTYLEKNYTRPIIYKKFYDIFGYHEKYLSVIFKARYGMSPSKYVTHLRMEAAKQMLREHPSMLLRDVCESIGMDD
jgi:YesN/AraC family two-component response regulator